MRVSNAEVGAARRMFASLPSAAVATTNADGSPHVVPLWFVWPEEAVFVSTRQDGRTWANALRDPRVAITIDLGRSLGRGRRRRDRGPCRAAFGRERRDAQADLGLAREVPAVARG